MWRKFKHWFKYHCGSWVGELIWWLWLKLSRFYELFFAVPVQRLKDYDDRFAAFICSHLVRFWAKPKMRKFLESYEKVMEPFRKTGFYQAVGAWYIRRITEPWSIVILKFVVGCLISFASAYWSFGPPGTGLGFCFAVSITVFYYFWIRF